jgi:hypothetical protein
MKILFAILFSFAILSLSACAGSSAQSTDGGGAKVDKKQQEKQLNETKASAEEAVRKMYELEKEKEELQK